MRIQQLVRAIITSATFLGTLLILQAASAMSQGLAEDLGPQPLADALEVFAADTGLQVVYQSEIATGLKSQGAQAGLSAEETLRQLLRETGLAFEFLNDHTIAIRTATAVPRSDSSRTPSAPQAFNYPEAAGAVAAKRTGWFDRFRIAQAEPTTETDRVSSEATSPNSQGRDEDLQESVELGEVLVTGSHIRGVEQPIGSQLIVIDREQIARSGRGRLQDILEVLPQNFSGSASERFQADAKAANFTRGQSVDLRGLGASSTLVLVNGRRQSTGGLEGAFVDISSIASSAIERIEVLADGASSLYGADAVGGVVNLVLRKNYEGLDTRVRLDTLAGDAQELQASVLGGQTWASGGFVLGYQYSDRDELLAADIFYGSRNRDFRALGGSDYRLAGGNPGTIVTAAGAPAFAIPRGQDGTQLTVADLIPGQNYQDYVTGVHALPKQQQHSAFFNVSQELTEGIELFAEGRYGKREMTVAFGNDPRIVSVPATNPYHLNPFGAGSVRVAYDFTKDLGVPTQESDTETYGFAAGGVASIGSQWVLNVAGNYGRETNDWRSINTLAAARLRSCVSGVATSGCPGAPLNLFGDGVSNDPVSLNFIRRVDLGSGVSETQSVTAIADGPLVQLPAGMLKLAVGADYREERLDATREVLVPATGVVTTEFAFVGKLSRDVAAVFAELAIPVLGDADSRRPTLDLSLSGRYEDYSDFGSTFNPRAGISFRPVHGVTLRGSWGTSFRAPRFNELSATSNPSQAFVFPSIPDPRSPTGVSDVIFMGGSSDLDPETAEIWTAGVDLQTDWAPGLSATATYFHIDYEDKIQVGGTGFTTLLLEDQWAEIITRDPSPAQIAAVCALPGFIGDCPTQVAAIIDGGLRNLGGVRVRGIDFSASYRTALPVGSASFGVGGVYTLDYSRALSPTAPFIDTLDTVANPLALKLRATIGWDIDNLTTNAYVNYAGSYHDIAMSRRVSSWTTVDASAAYHFTSGWLSGAHVRLSALNLFDKEPPFVNQIEGFDPANASMIGRSVSLEISRDW